MAFRSKPLPPKSNTPRSCFWYFLYGGILLWFGVLYYFHTLSNHVVSVTTNPPPAVDQPFRETKSVLEASAATQKPPQQLQLRVREEPIQAVEDVANDDLIHIVFSTDCSFFQDWQTLLVFHSAVTVKQKGQITRIASGCDEFKQKELLELYQKLFPQYHVHFTPDFKMDSKTKKKYDFYNKPYGLHHWLQYAQPAIDPGVIVILIDPDMILLRPFTLAFAQNPANLFLPTFNPKKDPIPTVIMKGHPIAQLYGLGAPWTVDKTARNFNRTAICGVDSPCMKVTRQYGEDHYSVGPPYILEKDDLLRLTDTWTTFVPRVYEKYPALLAEMYAYSMAAAHNELPHLTMLHLMVSNIDVDEEGWKHIDVLQDDVCQAPDADTGLFYPSQNAFPTVLHHCQFYRIGEFGFQKRRLRKQMFECNAPLMAQPPRNISEVRYKNRDGEIVKLGVRGSRRGTFMLCTIHYAINAMLRYYKEKMCAPDKMNLTPSVNLVSKEFW